MKLSSFATLLGLQRNIPARDRLIALREKHALPEDDPMWDVVAVVEEFCAALHAQTTANTIAASAPAKDARRAVQQPWRIAALGSAAAAIQTLLLALSFAAGAHANIESPFGAALAVPAGWVIFILIVPLIAALAYGGWTERRREPAIGWTILLCGVASVVALFVALWRAL